MGEPLSILFSWLLANFNSDDNIHRRRHVDLNDLHKCVECLNSDGKLMFLGYRNGSCVTYSEAESCISFMTM